MNSIYLKKSNPPVVVGKNKPFFQPKLTINQPNDNYRDEQETDAVADKVMLKTDNESIQQPFFSTAVQPPGALIQKQDDEQGSSENIEPVDEVETAGSAPEEAPNVTIELPLPMTIRVNGVMFTSPTFLLEGPNGRIVDLAPYTGSGLLDFPLAALESLGIPVLSFYHFHYGRARQFLGRHFESGYALSGGTSFIRNALHYGYITADDVTLFGAPSSFNLEHYGGIPHLNIVANPMDIGTMINVSYFNYPLFEGHNNPAVLFSINAPFDQNPFEAFTNLGGAIYHALSGDLYNLPGVTHSYPRFQSEPTGAIGSPTTRTRVSRKAQPGSAPWPTAGQLGQQTLTEKGSVDRLPVEQVKDHTHSNFFFFQPKLTLNGPNVPNNYRDEQEADAMADKVMLMANHENLKQPLFKPAISPIQPKCGHCEKEEEKPMQLKAMDGEEAIADRELESYVNNLNSGGQALTSDVLNFYEAAFRYDFSKVKVHTSSKAAKSAKSIGALAYTSGNNIVFSQNQYSPETSHGKKLLAHELTHIVQQNTGIQTKKIQRTFRLNELLQNNTPVHTNPIITNPNTSFYQGSTVNMTNRKALILSGIHGSEPSARALGHEIKNQLDSGSAHTDFHTLLVPQVNPTPIRTRGAGSASTRVSDLNREFGSGYTSPNPLAGQVTAMVNEFDPERVMSIHAINAPSLGGVFLDPIHSGTYPPTATATQRGQAFTGDPRNLEAMELADRMIGAIGNTASTPGNTPTSARPPSHFPGVGAGSSASSLIYPLQGSINTTAPTSLGVWVSGLGKPIITIEIPGYHAPRSVWQTFLPAVWEFLRIPPTVPPPAPTPLIQSIINGIGDLIRDLVVLSSRLDQMPVPLPREARPAGLPTSCLTFATRPDLDSRKSHWATVISSMTIPDTVNWVIGLSLPAGSGAAITESVRQKDCMLTGLSSSAAITGSPLQLAGTPRSVSGRRNFRDQSRIWQRKFLFDTRVGSFDRISAQARTICGALLLPAETQWNTRVARHRRCWGVAPLAGGGVPAFPVGTRSLTDDEKQVEILQASSAPGISRHHWGTDFDLFSVEPSEWESAGAGRNFADEYSWLLGNASAYGFIQSFTPLSSFRRLGYMEERWHWSYWPVAQALLEFVVTHQSDVETELMARWGTAAEFSFIRSHWADFMNNVNQTP